MQYYFNIKNFSEIIYYFNKYKKLFIYLFIIKNLNSIILFTFIIVYYNI